VLQTCDTLIEIGFSRQPFADATAFYETLIAEARDPATTVQ
jgi:hypothetical protein